MLSCPKCSHDVSTKSGIVKGRQRWKCKKCGYHYTVANRGATKEQKRQALELYLEGLGFRSIGRFLKFSHVAVYNWIREFGRKLDEIKSDTGIKIVEIDEMHSYVAQKKNYCWIWIAVDRDGRKFIDCVTGKRDTETGKKLWESVRTKAIGDVMTDHYKPYEAFVPVEKHTQSKAETFTVEGYNSFFRHFLARMRRKTKCYSKCEKMLKYSFKLLMVKWNGDLAILN